MCKPCTTAATTTAANTTSAAECRPADSEPARRRRPRKPTRLEELKRVATAALQAVGTFDFLMTEEGWWDGASDGTAESETLVAEFEAAGQLIAGAARILGKRYPKFFSDDRTAPHTYGSYLRHAARLMDDLDRDTGMVTGTLDEKNHVYHLYEVCPHLLAERSARNPAVCPQCGSKREFHMFCDDDGDREAWVCFTCEGNVKKAKKVLKSQRVNPDASKRGKAKKKAKVAPAPTPSPVSVFGLPWLGELDCRTDEEKAADEAAGVPPPVCFIPNTATPVKPATPAKPKPKPKPRMEKAPTLVNRIAAFGE